MPWFTRLTNGFSKKRRAALAQLAKPSVTAAVERLSWQESASGTSRSRQSRVIIYLTYAGITRTMTPYQGANNVRRPLSRSPLNDPDAAREHLEGIRWPSG